MGVAGLWDLLSPVGHRVSNEQVRNKVLAVDVSIWLTQFIKAMRETDGAITRNAHLLGVLRRCLKLLFIAVRPVLIFDGDTPEIKRRTVALRGAAREKHAAKLRKLAEKLLFVRLKQSALNAKLPSRLARSSTPSLKAQPASREHVHGLEEEDESDEITPQAIDDQPSPAKAVSPTVRPETADNNAYDDHAVADTASPPDEDPISLPEDLDTLDDETLFSLPSKLQSHVLKQLKHQHRARRRDHLMQVQHDPAAFSQQQIDAFMRTTTLNRRINNIRNAVNIQSGASTRIASDVGRQYVFEERDERANGQTDDFDSDDDDDLPPSNHSKSSPGKGEALDILAKIRAKNDAQRAWQQRLDDRNTRETRKSEKDASGVAWASKVLQGNGALVLGSDQVMYKSLRDSDDISDKELSNDMKEYGNDREATQNVDGEKTDGEESDDDVEWVDGNEESDIDDFSFPISAAVARVPENDMVNLPHEKQSSNEPVAASFVAGQDEISNVDVNSHSAPKHISGPPAAEGTGKSGGSAADCRGVRQIIQNVLEKDTRVSTDVTPRTMLHESTRLLSEEVGRREGNIAIDTIHVCSVDDVAKEKMSKRGATSFPRDVKKGKTEQDGGDYPICEADNNTRLMSERSSKWSANITEKKNGVNGIENESPVDTEDVIVPVVSKKVTDLSSAKGVQGNIESRKVGDEFSIIDDDGIITMVSKSEKGMEPRDVVGKDVGIEGKEDKFPIDDEDEISPRASTSSRGLALNAVNSNCVMDRKEEFPIDDEDVITPVVSQASPLVSSRKDRKDVNVDRAAGEIDFEVSSAEEVEKMRRQLETEEREIQREKSAHQAGVEVLSDEMYSETRDMLKLLGIPYMEAPMEAEAQCAFLNLHSVVDGIITEDSDSFLFGARTVYRKLFSHGRFAEAYESTDVEKKLGLGREELIRLAYLLGSDYTSGVRGVGVVNSMEILEAFPGSEGLTEFRDWTNKVTVFDEEPNEETMTGTSKDAVRLRFCWKHRNMKRNWEIREGFPNPAVAEAYWKPIVDNNTDKFKWGHIDFDGLGKFCWEKFGWEQERYESFVGPLRNELKARTGPQQTRIDEFFKPHRFAMIRSERLKNAVQGIVGDESKELMSVRLPKASKSTVTASNTGVSQKTNTEEEEAEEAQMVDALDQVEKMIAESRGSGRTTEDAEGEKDQMKSPPRKRRRRKFGAS